MKTESSTLDETAPVPTTNGHTLPARGPVIHLPTKEEREAALAKFFAGQNKLAAETSAAAEIARPAMARLAEVLRGRSGQPYKLRALLWSLYNGKPCALIEAVCLDWEIRKDFGAVLLAFGFEDPRDETNAFFYAAMKAAITQVGQWDWFVEESESEVAA